MCTRPPLFLWLIIIEQCWTGVLKLHRSEASGFWGAGIPKLLNKSLCPVVDYQIHGKLYYHAIVVRNRLQEQKLWGIFPGQKGLGSHPICGAWG